jgi:prepilin-type N-terminal cleavage/methylation domain-containing protein
MSRDAEGFTLLEIVVAVAILGVAVAIAMSVFSGGLKNVRRIDLAHRAMNHAENVMNEILSDEAVREPREFSGDLDEEFSYTASVDYWNEPQARPTIEPVELSVYMLSVRVDVHFKTDPHGKFYRTVCLKTLPVQPLPPGGPGSADVIRQLFGGPQR